MSAVSERTRAFCARFGLQVPILLAPMAGACPPSLSSAVANAGGMGSCGALPMQPQEIVAWASQVRASSNGAFQLNLWIPDPPPARNADHEARLRDFLGRWGPAVSPEAADAAAPNFDDQCEAILKVGPPVVSSIMGLYPAVFIAELKRRGISWFATASTVAEAREAEAAGADVIVAQGMEAGGHRSAFDASLAERRLVGLFALLPTVVDAVRVPVIGTGGIADARGVAAALALGASAAQIGTAFLRCPEAEIHPAWADALGRTAPEDTILTRAFSGRPGRSVANEFTLAAAAPDAPLPAPFPVQRALTTQMRSAAVTGGDIHRMQAWCGQASSLAKAVPAADVVREVWTGACQILA